MQKNRIAYIIFCLACFSISVKTYSQTTEDTASSSATGVRGYSFVAYISGGIGYYATNPGTPVSVTTKTSKLGAVATLRILWHPDHLLRIGIETGYMTFYSYTIKDSAGNTGKSTLSGVPILLVVSMPITHRLNAFFGTGFYNLTTSLNYAGKVDSHKLSVGWMLAASYIQPVNKRLGIGTEIKWMDAAQTVDGSIVAQLQLVWKFVTW